MLHFEIERGGYKGRFGWHNLRHSLASFFGANEVHPAVTQSILRHKKLSTTMEIYTHGINSVQVAAQEKYLTAIGLTSTSEDLQLSTVKSLGFRQKSKSGGTTGIKVRIARPTSSN